VLVLRCWFFLLLVLDVGSLFFLFFVVSFFAAAS
jgi:hypothetical protein